jgi:hypothetical protein
VLVCTAYDWIPASAGMTGENARISPCRGFGGVPQLCTGVIARSEATKQSRGGAGGQTYGLPRLLVAHLGEWLAMTGLECAEERSPFARGLGVSLSKALSAIGYQLIALEEWGIKGG